MEMIIDSASRSDSGVFNVKASNQSGEVSEDIKVLVCGQYTALDTSRPKIVPDCLFYPVIVNNMGFFI